jgi:hypothetical protein
MGQKVLYNNNGRSDTIALQASSVDLGNVDNTSDANKPVSSATQTALNAKVTGTLVTTVATPGTDTNIPSEQAVREAITSAVSGSSVPSWYHPFLFLGS